MFRQRSSLLLISCLVFFTSISTSFACGGLFCQNVPVAQQAERIIFTVNGNGTITAYVQINYTGAAPEFSWVVPVPSVPEIDVAEIETFDEIDRLTQPIILAPPVPSCAQMPPMPMAAMAESTMDMDDDMGAVEILASGTAGPYAYDVVDSPDPDALVEWLNENDYQVTEDMIPLIHVYNEEGMPFLAMKLQPEAGVQDIQPIAMTYDSELPMIPIRLTAVAATPNMNILTWIFSEKQAIPENYANPRIPDTDIRGDFTSFTGNNYMQLVDEAIDEEIGLAMVTEYVQPTSDLSNMQITDPLLQTLTQQYSYVTRFLGRMSPEEMTLDPVFNFDGDKANISPIMTNSESIHQFGNNAYGKPATALNILRETVMGRELFDYAFKEYAQRWMFKHPTPEDFFRTMEDASAFDLDWFWRGWFYTTDWTDIGIKEVKKYYVSSEPNKFIKDMAKERGRDLKDLPPLVYMVEEGSEEFKADMKNGTPIENSTTIKAYIMDNFTPEEQKSIKAPKYFYNITFDKPGGLVMPIIVEYTYADGTSKTETYPAQIWRFNDNEVSKAIASDKEIVGIKIDPNLETADIDTANNSWPKEIKQSQFEKFKDKVKG